MDGISGGEAMSTRAFNVRSIEPFDEDVFAHFEYKYGWVKVGEKPIDFKTCTIVTTQMRRYLVTADWRVFEMKDDHLRRMSRATHRRVAHAIHNFNDAVEAKIVDEVLEAADIPLN